MDDTRQPAGVIDAEDARLQSFGYRPQFKRVLGLFADFSLGYSYMSPMAGLFGLFATAIVTGGPPFFWTMLVVLAGQTLVCLVFAEVERGHHVSVAVPQLHPGLQAPEQVGGEYDVAFLSIVVGDGADARVDAKDLLQEHDAGTAAAFGDGKISAERTAVRSGDGSRLTCQGFLLSLRPKDDTARSILSRGPNSTQRACTTGGNHRASPHYSREMRDQG